MKAASILASLLLISVASAQYAGYFSFTNSADCSSGTKLDTMRAYFSDKCFVPNQGSTYVPSTGRSMLTCNTTHVILTQYADADAECELALSTKAYPRNECSKDGAKWDCWTSLPDITEVDPEWQVSLEVKYFNGMACQNDKMVEWTATGYKACDGTVKTFCSGDAIVAEVCDEGCESGCERVASFPTLESQCMNEPEGNWDIQVDVSSNVQSAFPTCKGVQGHPTSAAEAKAPSMWILGLLILAVLF